MREVVGAAAAPSLTSLQPAPPSFKPGDLVRVRRETAPVRVRRPHLRTPGYIFGVVGTIERPCIGAFKDPEHAAVGEGAPRLPLYR